MIPSYRGVPIGRWDKDVNGFLTYVSFCYPNRVAAIIGRLRTDTETLDALNRMYDEKFGGMTYEERFGRS